MLLSCVQNFTVAVIFFTVCLDCLNVCSDKLCYSWIVKILDKESLGRRCSHQHITKLDKNNTLAFFLVNTCRVDYFGRFN